MGLTNAGRDFIAKSIINEAGVTPYDGTNAHIGVGSGGTAFSVTQTDLVGASKTRKVVDSAPVRAANEIEFITTFDTAEAQHDWLEWGVFNAATGGEMINRKVENLGSKTGGTWVLTVALSVNIG
jgi:hypothetical protein